MGLYRGFDKLVSIHAPRVGSDRMRIMRRADTLMFQSTPPVWGATSSDMVINRRGDVSIHAPRVGSDQMQDEFWQEVGSFNPRPPCGERPSTSIQTLTLDTFQSTPPVWGATQFCHVSAAFLYVSIHAPRVGSDILY